MTICNAQIGVPNYSTNNCGTPCQNQCADFIIKRHDTRPPFKVSVEDCNGPMDLSSTQLAIEVNMWTDINIKTAITASDTYFRLADDVGFEQIMQDDIIVVDRVRLPEQMLVIGFDETNKLVRVQRGYHGTTPSAYKKGQSLKSFRILNGVGEVELVYDDILNADGSTTNKLTESYVVYNWQSLDTCVPGCFLLEFKLVQMVIATTLSAAPITPSFTPSFTPSSYTPVDFGCVGGLGVDWERRLPLKEGFVIQVVDTPTTEVLV